MFTTLQNELCFSRFTRMIGWEGSRGGGSLGVMAKCNNIIMLLKLKHEQQFII